MAGIKKPTVSGKKVPGRQPQGGIIASGVPIIHLGRIAGGAPEIQNFKFQSTFPANAFLTPLGSSPGGLVDRKQLIDPSSTKYGHPFGGGRYKSISTQIVLPTIINWNGFLTHQETMPLNQPHERGTFFQKKVRHPIKTVFGTNQTGRPADTAFHRQKRIVLPRPAVRSSRVTEHISREYRPPAFLSHNRLINDPNNSHYGMGGRWGMLKRSASDGS